jgi:hypothetical protein
VSLASRLLLSVQLNGFAWSAGLLVDSFSEARQTLDLYHLGPDGRALSGYGVGMSVSMTATLDHYRTAHIKIFSRFALIDRTGLDASVRTRRLLNRTCSDSDFFNQYSTVERRTYARKRPIPVLGDDIGAGGSPQRGLQGSVSDRGDRSDRREYFSEEWDDGGWGGESALYDMDSPYSPHNGANMGRDGGQRDGLAGASWAHGAHGISLFHSDPQDSKFSVGINRGSVWTEPMSLLSLGASKVPFELTDKGTQCAYQLAHSTSQLPGAFKGTQLVSLVPCYCVVNCLYEFIELRQVGAHTAEPSSKELADLNNLFFPPEPADQTPSRKKCMVDGQSSAGWHRYDVTKGTSVQFRCDSSAWSLGTVNLNEIGTTVLLVPKKKAVPNFTQNNPKTPGKTGTTSGPNKQPYSPQGHPVEDALVLHVEVRFADPADHSYINIVVWAPVPDPDGQCHRSSLSIRNHSPYSVVIRQTGTDTLARAARADPSRFTMRVGPGSWRPYGWADQSHGTSVSVTLDPLEGQYWEDRGPRSSLDSTSYRRPSPTCDVDILKIGQTASIKLPGNESRGDLFESDSDTVNLTVMAGAGGQILHISMKAPPSISPFNMRRPLSASIGGSHYEEREKEKEKEREKENAVQAAKKNFTLKFSLKSIGLSLIAERPVRREFMSLYLDGLDGRMVQKYYPNGVPSKGGMRTTRSGGEIPMQRLPSVITSYSLTVADMQVDNYSETAVFPVLMHSFSASHRERKKAARRRKRAIRRTPPQARGRGRGRGRPLSESADDDFPFVALSVVQELTEGSIAPIFKYVALRVLEIKLAVDSSTLQLYFCDLHGDLGGETREQALAVELPEEWVEQFNYRMVGPGYRRVFGDADGSNTGGLVDLLKTMKTAQEGKMYFETFVIHPMKLRLSFLPTPFPRSKHEDILSAEQYRGFKIIRAIAQVDELVVKVSMFLVTESMDSVATLADRVMASMLKDFQNHLVTIVGRVFGSLEFIGKPAGLYRNVGEGVKEFFYEVCSQLVCSHYL